MYQLLLQHHSAIAFGEVIPHFVKFTYTVQDLAGLYSIKQKNHMHEI